LSRFDWYSLLIVSVYITSTRSSEKESMKYEGEEKKKWVLFTHTRAGTYVQKEGNNEELRLCILYKLGLFSFFINDQLKRRKSEINVAKIAADGDRKRDAESLPPGFGLGLIGFTGEVSSRTVNRIMLDPSSFVT